MLCGLLAVGCFSASAAEISLRPTALISGKMLTLGDLCEVADPDPVVAAELSGLALGPAPTAGRSQIWRLREIQDRLSLAGVNLAEHRFGGSAQVTLQHARAATPAEQPLSDAQLAAIEEAVEAAIESQLQKATTTADERLSPLAPSPPTLVAKVQLTQETARQLSASSTRIVILTPIQPDIGFQEISVCPRGQMALARSLRIELRPAPQVVVSTRGVPRGAMISAADVRLVPMTKRTLTGALTSLESVIGKEASLAIAPGQTLTGDYLQNPILVRRGEVVDLSVLTGGVQIRTKGRARSDGGLGDVVQVDLLENKQAVVARVAGPQAVEILGGSGGVAR
ncbi:MAG: flagellar basal body P-ring formation chaperone FlgA [Pirellulales bacterium]|nr:flagellar basal body P-ring formation chaperone FlgA [Pirellulales bacterium]